MAAKKRAAKQTPVMQQHAAAKNAYPDCVVFFRMGDFYEMFGEDAVLVAKVLGLTLTARNKGKPDEIPMAGVPHHAGHGYIGRLLKAGYKVAICEQMADPSTVKGIVPREVVRVLTPGTVTSSEHLEARSNNWLAAVELGDAGVGLALLDISTGELAAAQERDLAWLLGELSRAAPSEILLGAQDGQEEERDRAVESLKEVLGGVPLRTDEALSEAETTEQLGDLGSDAAQLSTTTARSVARALRFARRCNPSKELPVRRIARWDPSETVVIDPVAQKHLELDQSLVGDSEATLLAVIDLTKTAMGARALRRRLLAPLFDVAQIRRRLDAVQALLDHAGVRSSFREALGGIGDLERLAVRASFGEATPRELGLLRDGLLGAARAVAQLDTVTQPAFRETLSLTEAPDLLPELAQELDAALVERPPNQLKEGGIFRAEFDKELSELKELKDNGTQAIVELETRLREQTDIPNLKIRYTRVFGWYVEVSKSHVARSPKKWHRKQTVAGGERYTFEELDELAERIQGADEQFRARELSLLSALVEHVRAASSRIFALGARIAAWDVAANLAEVAHRYDYCRPDVDEGTGLEIVEGRHPVVERLAAAGSFVPNDVTLNYEGERLWLITGPNMAGKSTLLRQTALIAILGQMGSYVPAKQAHIGVVDRVLSRVGASDNLARGESTFMVEMKETAEILRSATKRSLVIVDEIGRGTSTFDGLAIAWAVAEYLNDVVGARALFATHYHELTTLGDEREGVANHSVSARELDGNIVFLHRLVSGAASRSYGVAVAKLAGLPEAALARAQAILNDLEAGEAAPLETKRRQKQTPQLGLFAERDLSVGPSKEQKEVLDTLSALDPDRLTPMDALTLLAQLKGRLRRK